MPDYWEGWSSNPDLNIAAPPLGAPELMKAGKLNDSMRVVMAACAQLGARLGALTGPPPTGAVATLKGMAYQDPAAVAITGGTVAATHTGIGTGLTALNATQLTSGTVPPAATSGTYPISISGNAATASALTGSALDAVLPPGTIILWYGNAASIPAGWKLCDGTLGTPNMVGAVPIGAHSVNDPVGVRHGTGNLSLANAPTHTHAGSADNAHVLTIGEMPLHGHPFRVIPSQQSIGPTGGLMVNTGSSPAPSNQAAYTGTPADTAGQQIGGTGGGGGHQHGLNIVADGVHTHTGTLDQVRVGLHFLMRA